MSETIDKLNIKLRALAGDDKSLLHIVGFIVYALESGNHDDIAERFEPGKKLNGMLSLSGCYKYCESKAEELADKERSAMVEAPEVYGWVAEYLGLQDSITREEIIEYCRREILEVLGANVAAPEPVVVAEKATATSDGLDLGIDDLFG